MSLAAQQSRCGVPRSHPSRRLTGLPALPPPAAAASAAVPTRPAHGLVAPTFSTAGTAASSRPQPCNSAAAVISGCRAGGAGRRGVAVAAASPGPSNGGMGGPPLGNLGNVRRPTVAARAAVVADDMRGLEMEMEMCNITSRYSPEYVKRRVLAEPGSLVAVVQRIADIVTRMGLFLSQFYLDQVLQRGDTPDIVRTRAAQLRETLTVLGPSFIKAGQVLASRPDIVREDYMAELCLLQDDVPSFPDEQAFAMMRQQIGGPIETVFSSISERPIAAASLGQVYKAVLRDTGETVAIKVQRPNVEPTILRDLYVFRALASFFNPWTRKALGCNAELIVDEFGEKILEELDYTLEARNIQEFGSNFAGDPTVKIPWVRRDLCGPQVLVMEWIDGIRCTNPQAIIENLDRSAFIKCGVVSGLRQLLEFGLFHGDPHPGNIFAMRDGRIAYVDFGNVAQLSQANKAVLIDAVVHAVNEDYRSMAGDFIKLGFLAPGTDITPITPALEKIWADSKGQALSDFNFRTVTSKFNELVYQYPIRIPERYSLVIRSLLTQEGICMTLDPTFHFLEVAYPYVARRLLTDDDPSLRERLIQVLFQDGKFQWARLENLIMLAKEGGGTASGLDLSETVKDAVRVFLLDDRLRTQIMLALTEDDRLRIPEVMSVLRLVQADVKPDRLVRDLVRDAPSLGRDVLLSWADRVLVS
uniref:Protein kinase domain-containing protein n=1 Tax=Chlamydomonas euryale TaxID=1486919 RepID=A0A7R9YW22_9CHLO|mmetsp:Transcript_29814/g.88287  ORF Transcript_29814/g.88287 Transcript_29814/m.88287 type:complete len:700 (+) Transcript_29814:215-2314(+)